MCIRDRDVWFADSLYLFKNLIKSQLPALRNAEGTFPKTNQSSLYKTLFNQTFDAHDALEDVLALRKILFSSKLELSNKTIVETLHSPTQITHSRAWSISMVAIKYCKPSEESCTIQKETMVP